MDWISKQLCKWFIDTNNKPPDVIRSQYVLKVGITRWQSSLEGSDDMRIKSVT